MKKMPEIKGSWKRFYDLTGFTVRSTLFKASLEWKIYDYMQNRVSASDIASDLDYNKRNLELVLNALAGMGIIEKSNGLFINSPDAQEFLVSTGSAYIGEFLLYISKWNTLTEEDYGNLVKNGPPEEQPDMSDEAFWAKGAELSAAYQYAGDAQKVASIIAGIPEFSSIKTMLDMGGGPGFYAMAMVNRHPDMKAVIFDQPAVTEVAADFIKSYEMEDRISVRAGNYMEDSLGGKYDLIFASATLNFFKGRLDEIIEKIYESLEPGGSFISYSDGMTKEKTHPVEFATGFLAAELGGNDFSFHSGLVGDIMLEKGFNRVRSFFVNATTGEMEITIGRKGK